MHWRNLLGNPTEKPYLLFYFISFRVILQRNPINFPTHFEILTPNLTKPVGGGEGEVLRNSVMKSVSIETNSKSWLRISFSNRSFCLICFWGFLGGLYMPSFSRISFFHYFSKWILENVSSSKGFCNGISFLSLMFSPQCNCYNRNYHCYFPHWYWFKKVHADLVI